MLRFNELDGEQRRQLIDTHQVFEACEVRRLVLEKRYAGSMRWGERGGSRYLLRKHGRSETSLGPRSAETEEVYRQFVDGRQRVAEEVKSLEGRLERLAAVNSALGIGRVPKLTARILRRLGDAGVLGRNLHVVGTNALFAYESSAGVRFESAVPAPGDPGLLMDARRRLRLAIADMREEGVLGILRRVDKSFELDRAHAYRVFNRDGFCVDLIRPQARNEVNQRGMDRIGQAEYDLDGAPIRGLDWLVNAPKVSAVALDESGFPVRIEAVDPRAFALHKAWVSGLPDRDPIKKFRDREQAEAVASLSVRYLNLSFADRDLTALPRELRDQAAALLAAATPPAPVEGAEGKPNWW